jgi:hypothetical protein
MQKKMNIKKAVFRQTNIKNLVSIFVVFLLVFASFATVIGRNVDVLDSQQGHDEDVSNYDNAVVRNFNAEHNGERVSSNLSDLDENESEEDSDEIVDKPVFPFLKRPDEVDYSRYTKNDDSDVVDDDLVRSSSYFSLRNKDSENGFMFSFLSDFINKFVDRFPILANLPFFSRFVRSEGVTSDEGDSGCELCGSCGSSMGILSEDEEEDDPDIIIVPTAGSFLFLGQGSMDLDFTMDVNGTIVTISSHVFIGPDTGFVEITWNKTLGYLEITGDGYFEFSNLYLNINNNIIFVTSSLVVDTNGYILLEHQGFEGDFSFEGVIALEDLSFDVNLEDILGANISVSGTFDFSMIGEAENLGVSWDESGISANGNFIGESVIDVYDFSLKFDSILIAADLISFRSSAVFEFTEDAGVVFCLVSSVDILIEGLYLGFGDFGIFVDSVQVDTSLEFMLEIDSDSYITAEEGHIIIGGSMFISIDTVVEIDDNVVAVKGDFYMGGLDHTVEISWNKNLGFFKLESKGGLSKIYGLAIGIDDNWINLGFSSLELHSDTHIIVEKSGDNAVFRYQGSKTKATGLYFVGKILDSYISVDVGSIYSATNGICYLNINWTVDETGNETAMLVEAFASKDRGIAIADISISYNDFLGYIGSIFLFAEWTLEYDTDRIWFKIDGTAQFTDFGIGIMPERGSSSEDLPSSPAIWFNYFYIDGILESEVYNGTWDISLAPINADLVISASPVGGITLHMSGNVNISIDIASGRFNGYFGAGGRLTVMGMGLTFDVSGEFSGFLDGDNLRIYCTFAVGGSTGLGLLFNVAGIYIRIGIRATGGGQCFAIVNINLTTGEIDLELFCSLVFFAKVHIYDIHQTNTSGEFNGWLVEMDEIKVDWNMIIGATISIHISFKDGNFNLGISGISAYAYGSPEFQINNLRLKKVDSDNILEIEIGRIEINGDFQLWTPNLYKVEFSGDFNLKCEDINFYFKQKDDKPEGYPFLYPDPLEIWFSIDKIEGELSIDYDGVLSLSGLNLELHGNAEINGFEFGVSNYRVDGPHDQLLDFSSSIDAINLDLDLNIFSTLSEEGNIEIFISAEASLVLEDITFAISSSSCHPLNGFSDSSEVLSLKIESVVFSLGGECKIILDDDGNSAITYVGDAMFTIDDFYLSVFGGFVEVSCKSFIFDFSGSINVYPDGTVEAEGGVSLSLEDLIINIAGFEIHIKTIELGFDGTYRFIPGENGAPPKHVVNGTVEVDITVGTSYFRGTASVDAEITFEVKTTEEGWTIDFGIDGEISDGNLDITWGFDQFYLWYDALKDITDDFSDFSDIDADWFRDELPNFDVICNQFGVNPDEIIDIIVGLLDNIDSEKVDQLLSLLAMIGSTEGYYNIENFHGSGMFEFYVDTSTGDIYLNNQLGSNWDSFTFSALGGLLTGNINQFDGDLHFTDFIVGVDSILDNMENGWLNPEDWTIQSETGYDTIFGLSFSSDGLIYEGDIATDLKGLTLHVYELKLDPRTDGSISLDRYEDGYRLSFNSNKEGVQGRFGLEFDIDKSENPLLYDILGDSFEIGLTVQRGETEVELDVHININALNNGNYGQFIIDLLGLDVDPDADYPVFNTLNELINWLQDKGENFGDLVDIGDLTINGMTLSDFAQHLKDKGYSLPAWLVDLLDRITEAAENRRKWGDACFLAGTQIEMADGSTKNIEDIVVGDTVVSYDIDSEEWKTGIVSYVFYHNPSEMTDYYLVLNDDLEITPNHPIFVNGTQITAGELQVGDVFGDNIITSIDMIYERVPTFNFEVVPYHTYNVVWGDMAKSLVHNDGHHDQVEEIGGQVGGDSVPNPGQQGAESGNSDDYIMTKTMLTEALATPVPEASPEIANAGMPLDIEDITTAETFHMAPKVFGTESFSVTANAMGTYDLQFEGVTVAESLNAEQVRAAALNHVSSSYGGSDSSPGSSSSESSSSESTPTIYSLYDGGINIDFSSYDLPVSGTPLGVPVEFDGTGSMEVSTHGLSADTRIFVVDKYFPELKPWLGPNPIIPIPNIIPISTPNSANPIDNEPVNTDTNTGTGTTTSYHFGLLKDLMLFNTPELNSEDRNDDGSIINDNQDDNPWDTTNPLDNNESEDTEAPQIPGLGCTHPSAITTVATNEDGYHAWSGYYQVKDISRYDIIEIYNSETQEMDTTVVADVIKHVTPEEYVSISISSQGYIQQDIQSSQEFLDALQQYKDCINSNFGNTLQAAYHFSQDAEYDIIYPDIFGEHILVIGPEQLVYTSEGFKRADDIKVGDMVFTEEGFKQVTLAETNQGVITTYSILTDLHLERPSLLDQLNADSKGGGGSAPSDDDDGDDDGDSGGDGDESETNIWSGLYNGYFESAINRDAGEGVNEESVGSAEKSIDSVRQRATDIYFADGILVGGNKTCVLDESSFVNKPAADKSIGGGFTKGTMIKMADGTYKDISMVSEGDQIKAYDTTSDTLVDSSVTVVEHYKKSVFMSLLEKHGCNSGYLVVDLAGVEVDSTVYNGEIGTFQDSLVQTDEKYELNLTYDQQVYVLENPAQGINKENIVVIPAVELSYGYVLITSNGGLAYVLGVSSVSEPVDIYSIQVKDYRNYFADDILVIGSRFSGTELSSQEINDEDDDTPSGGDSVEVGDGIQLSSYDTSYFGYYDSVDYGLFFKENPMISHLHVSSIIENFILKLVEKFPVLEKISFIQKIIGDRASQDDAAEDSDVDKEVEDVEDIVDPTEQDNTGVQDTVDNTEIADDTYLGSNVESLSQIAEIADIIVSNPDVLVHYVWKVGDSFIYGQKPTHVFKFESDSNADDDGQISYNDRQVSVVLYMFSSNVHLIDQDHTVLTFEDVPSNLEIVFETDNYLGILSQSESSFDSSYF